VQELTCWGANFSDSTKYNTSNGARGAKLNDFSFIIQRTIQGGLQNEFLDRVWASK